MEKLRQGITTGTCAAAAAKAALSLMCGDKINGEVEIPMPDGSRRMIPVKKAAISENSATATVIKDSGDDPDVTNGMEVVVTADWADDQGDIIFNAGEGVGTVTRRGLQIPPGEPAINPAPREMITTAVKEVTKRSVRITISIPGGEKVAEKTFNPRLGVEGGLSILGTTGIVRPYSHSAIIATLRCSLDVLLATGERNLIFTGGNIGTKTALQELGVGKDRVVEVSNEWGEMLDYAKDNDIDSALILGHPGKLAKLTTGYFDTHSSKSPSAVPIILALAKKTGIKAPEDANTAEEIFTTISPKSITKLAQKLAMGVTEAASKRVDGKFEISCALINMKNEIIGHHDDLTKWKNQ